MAQTAQQRKFAACGRKTKGLSKLQRQASMKACLRGSGSVNGLTSSSSRKSKSWF